MPKRPDIYELLAAQQASDTTTTQLNSALKSTYIDKSNVDFWAGVITVARALEDSRTYAHGIVIPETGAVQIETIANGANSTITPTGTEVWRIISIAPDSCSIALKDADGNMSPMFEVDDASTLGGIFLSASMSIIFFNGSGSEQTPSIAYFKVSL